MPELPEVDVFRRDLAARGLGVAIAHVRLQDPDFLHGASPAELRAALEQDRFASVTRHGKILFAETSRGAVLVTHFGMTGELRFLPPGVPLPAGICLLVGFVDGRRLAVLTTRKLGWFELTEDMQAYLRAHRVGPDAQQISARAFAEKIGAARGSLKSALMDQSKVAGIGNVYSDEVLFRAGLSPRSKGRDLSADQLTGLHRAMRSVLKEAILCLSGGRDLPGDWLARHRQEGAACPRCGAPLSRQTISGRSAYFCPHCQKPAAA